MIVIENFDGVPTNLLKQITPNETLELLTQKRREFEINLSTVQEAENEIAVCVSELETYKARKILFDQLAKQSGKMVAKLEKIYETEEPDIDMKMLDRDKMQAFFESMGLRFLNVRVNNDHIVLNYIRPSKKLESFWIQPLVVSMAYKKMNDCFNLRSINVYYLFSPRSNNYIHPHVNSSEVCMGNILDVLTDNGSSLFLTDYMDHVIATEELLSTYNTDSPYETLDVIMYAHLTGGYRYWNATLNISIGGNDIIIHNSKIHGLTGYVELNQIIPPEYIKDFYEKMENIPLLDAVDQFMEKLSNLYNEDNDGSDNYEYFSTFCSKVYDVLGLSLTDVSDYATYDDDNDYYVLDYDSADDLERTWKKEFIVFLNNPENKDRTFRVHTLPNIVHVLGTEESEE